MLPKTYAYKVYRDGEYLGLLPNVISEFSYSQDINSGFSQLSIVVGASADVNSNDVEALQTELGEDITDEFGAVLTTERPLDLVGNDNPNALIRCNNTIEVYEYSDDDINGVLVFAGYMEDWEASYGGSENINVACLSYGVDLTDYIIQTGTSTITTQSIDTTTATPSGVWGKAFAQQIEPVSNIAIDGLRLKLANNGALPTEVMLVYGNPELDSFAVITGANTYTLGPGNVLLATSTTVQVNAASPTEYYFAFDESHTLAAGSLYYALFWYGAFETNVLQLAGAGLADLPIVAAHIGELYTALLPTNNMSTNPVYSTAFPALYIELLSTGGSVVSPYTNSDPTVILRDIIDNYVGQGGRVNYSASSTDLTGLSIDYEFNLQTTLEGVKKCLELAPADWYWYVNPATQVLYFLQTEATATHTFIKGLHISKLQLKASIENVRNLLYFSGGLSGATNLFTKYVNTTSRAELGRQRLERKSDNRVTVQATADAIGEAFLDEHESEDYQTRITIIGATYDLASLNPGDTIGFSGFGNFVDNLILQIVNIRRHPDYAELTVGQFPPRQTAMVQQALADIDKLQTIDNPSTPS